LRSPLAWLLLLYPPLVLCIIVHRPSLDPRRGRRRACVAFGFIAAWLLYRNRPRPAVPPPEPRVRAIALAIGYALAVDFADALSAGRVSLTDPSPASIGVPLLIVAAAVLARRARPD
jgi:peptidoglycan/LPS O-acetylase OafA/YrhL